MNGVKRRKVCVRKESMCLCRKAISPEEGVCVCVPA